MRAAHQGLELRRLLSTMFREPIASRAAWRSRDLASTAEWTHTLTAAQAADLVRATRDAKAAGATLATLKREAFALPTLEADLRAWGAALDRGLGFVLVRGFPVAELGPDDSELAYYGLGLHLGNAVPQNMNGDLLGHVRDHGVTPGPTVRRYMTREAQGFHTDGADVIGLLCLRPARSGGLSRIVSSVAIYDEILRRRPELVDLLYEPVSFKGDFVFQLPICSVHGGRLRTFYIGWYIRDAQKEPEVPKLRAEQLEVLDLLDELADDPAFHLDMDFRVGDIQLLNNATILHARTAYEDFDEADRKRHLLRLWLTPHDFSSVEPELAAGVPHAQLR